MSKYDVHQIPLDLIDKNPLNPQTRGEASDIKGLMQSITESGLYYPVLVNKTKEGRYLMIEGHRRLAVFLTKKEKNPDFAAIPALVLQVGDEYLTRIFREINETAKKLTGKQWLEVAALGGAVKDLPSRLAPSIKALQGLFSPEELRRIASRQGPSVYGLAKRVATTCQYTDGDLRTIITWLVNSGDSVNVRIEMDEGRTSKIREAISSGKRISGEAYPFGDLVAGTVQLAEAA